jgi:hypothetical protein
MYIASHLFFFLPWWTACTCSAMMARNIESAGNKNQNEGRLQAFLTLRSRLKKELSMRTTCRDIDEEQRYADYEKEIASHYRDRKGHSR